MSKRYTITRYLEEYFEPGSAPSRSTVIRLLDRGDLPGEKIGKVWYVMPDKSANDQGLDDLITEFDKEAVQYVDGAA